MISSLVVLAGGVAAVTQAQPLMERLAHVTLTLTTDRSIYCVGEPIRFTLMVRNHGSENVSGYFRMNGEESDVYYRKAPGPFVKLSAPTQPSRPEPDRVSLPLLLKPEEERQSQRVLTLNPITGGLLLEEPGDYDFKILSYPRRPLFDEERVIETSVVRVRVEAPPAGQDEALSAYRKDGLASLVQVPYGYAVYEPAVLKRAAEFLGRYPHGPYGQHVRRALTEALRFKVVRHEATKDERGLYERLQADLPPER